MRFTSHILTLNEQYEIKTFDIFIKMNNIFFANTHTQKKLQLT